MCSRNLNTTVFLLVLVAGGVMLGGLACGENDNREVTEADMQADPQSHGLHMIRDRELREIMNRLQALDLDAVSREMDETDMVPPELDDVAEMASTLAKDALVLPLVMKDQQMNDESRGLLVKLSQRLKNEADDLARAAHTGNARLASTRLDAMMKTCVDCHREFRAPALAKR